MSKHYRALTHTRAFAAGEVVTADQIKAADLDADDLVKRHAIEETTAPSTRTDTPGIPTDEQNKLNVERAVQEKTLEAGKPLTVAEQDKVAAETTADSGRPVRTDGKDTNKAEKLQERQRQAEQKAAAEGQPQPQRTPRPQ